MVRAPSLTKYRVLILHRSGLSGVPDIEMNIMPSRCGVDGILKPFVWVGF